MSRKFTERNQIVQAIVPVDGGAAANDGDWVKLADFRRAVIIFSADIGTAGEDPVLTLKQATSNAGAGAKALTFTRADQKEGATAISAIGQFTKITQAAAGTYTSASGGENEQLVVIEVEAEDLDTNGGFTHIQLSVPDIGAAGKLISAIYILEDSRHPQETLASAIV